MKRPLMIFGLVAMLTSVQAETLRYGDTELSLKDRARACYLRVIELYDASYFRSGGGDVRCVRLDYLRSFDGQELTEATEEIFARLHGQSGVSRYRAQLDAIAEAYQPVTPKDSYQFCASPDGGELWRDGEPVSRFDDPAFSSRFMSIWIKGDDTAGAEWNFSRCFGSA